MKTNRCNSAITKILSRLKNLGVEEKEGDRKKLLGSTIKSNVKNLQLIFTLKPWHIYNSSRLMV